MRNPFVAMAMDAVASLAMFRSMRFASFNKGEHAPGKNSYRKATGLTVAAAHRAATKARTNQARHKAACRG